MALRASHAPCPDRRTMTEHQWSQHLSVRIVDGVAIVEIDRRERLNALDAALLDDLHRAAEWLDASDEVRGVVLRGAGERAFVAGADLDAMGSLEPDSARDLSRKGQMCFLAFEGMGKPVVAAVHGFALGGGCELALACHLRVCSEDALFGFPEVGLGLIPGFGGTVRLPRLIGIGRALEMICTGRRVPAEEALRIGLVNDVVTPVDLVDRAVAMVRSVLENGPIAVTAAIRSAYYAMDATADEAFEAEAELFGSLAATDDMKEGIRAFLEKRSPEFRGR